jgi:hypothetical protein
MVDSVVMIMACSGPIASMMFWPLVRTTSFLTGREEDGKNASDQTAEDLQLDSKDQVLNAGATPHPMAWRLLAIAGLKTPRLLV